MGPIAAFKLWLRWKPEIEEVESAIKDAKGNNMKAFWIKISHVALPLVYAAAGGALGAVADYAHTAVSGEHVDFARMGTIALAGASMALKAYFQQPRQKPTGEVKP